MYLPEDYYDSTRVEILFEDKFRSSIKNVSPSITFQEKLHCVAIWRYLLAVRSCSLQQLAIGRNDVSAFFKDKLGDTFELYEAIKYTTVENLTEKIYRISTNESKVFRQADDIRRILYIALDADEETLRIYADLPLSYLVEVVKTLQPTRKAFSASVIGP